MLTGETSCYFFYSKTNGLSEKPDKPLRCIPIRKFEENEIAESLRIQESFPQASFDLGCQGELTQ